jgi:hypothetical protein
MNQIVISAFNSHGIPDCHAIPYPADSILKIQYLATGPKKIETQSYQYIFVTHGYSHGFHVLRRISTRALMEHEPRGRR